MKNLINSNPNEIQQLIGHAFLREQSITDFEVDWDNDRLGKGSFGKVFQVKNINDQVNYALKCIELGERSHKQFNQRNKDMWALKKLNHQHIVRYYRSCREKVKTTDFPSLFNEQNENESPMDIDTDTIPRKYVLLTTFPEALIPIRIRS